MIEGFHEMTDAERRNLLWGLRDGSCGHMNRLRRERFDSVKECLVSRDEYQPAPLTNVIAMPAALSAMQNAYNAQNSNQAALYNLYSMNQGANPWPSI